jgi:ribonuclease P protein subunit RPR2
MIRVAHERVGVLFSLAEVEARSRSNLLPNRYVELARKIGMRYNVRVPPEYRNSYCRRCSTYWVEGRTLRTRLRDGHRVQTCLLCGAIRRVRLGTPRTRGSTVEGSGWPRGTSSEPIPVDDSEESPDPEEGEEE